LLFHLRDQILDHLFICVDPAAACDQRNGAGVAAQWTSSDLRVGAQPAEGTVQLLEVRKPAGGDPPPGQSLRPARPHQPHPVLPHRLTRPLEAQSPAR